MHAVEMALEGVNVGGPEAAELRQPGIELLKRLRPQLVEAALRIHPGFNEARLAQYPQVLGYGGLGHTKLALDVSHRQL